MVVLLLYILCCLAALELNRRDVRSDGAPFKFRGQTLVPIVAIVFIVWVLLHAKKDEFVITGICLVAVSLLFLIRQLFIGKRARGPIPMSTTSCACTDARPPYFV